MKSVISLLLCTCMVLIGKGQSAPEVYPTHWWTGMKNRDLQLLIHVKGIGNKINHFSCANAGVLVKSVKKVENPNYLFLDISLAPTVKSGKIEFRASDPSFSFTYELKARRNGNGKQYAQGVTAADLVYLIMPDRFANGDPANDKFSDLRDTICDRANPFYRHGGDLQGIIKNLDYFKKLGVTAIWLCPIVENDMPLEKEVVGLMSGYHGYWMTNQYKIDKRYGGDEAYKTLIASAHKLGIKIIQDAVYNHMGQMHWSMEDLPMKNWVNQWPAYTNSNHRDEALFDPYKSENDKKVMLDGWFTPHLPDWNQRNPFVANFLIQNAIWTVEEFGIDGWRVDTYKYCDEPFLNRLNTALSNEFPMITTFGEAWANTVTGSAYFAQNNLQIPFKHNLQGVTDFPVLFAMLDAVKQNYGWTEGVSRLYMVLAQDLLYKDPMRNCIFLDNHDLNRFYSEAGEDIRKFKQGIGLLMTLRGIPQLYYGTEVLMKNFKNPSDAEVRKDFPGGWEGDVKNAFTGQGLSEDETEAQQFVSQLAHFRKTSSAITTGRFQQFIPLDGVYVYFRYSKDQTVMVVMNSADTEKEIKLDRFSERLNGFTHARSFNGEADFKLSSVLKVSAKGILILDLKKGALR